LPYKIYKNARDLAQARIINRAQTYFDNVIKTSLDGLPVPVENINDLLRWENNNVHTPRWENKNVQNSQTTTVGRQ